ncbi:MAG TPA: hypothetical protein VGE67_08770 [Haloferula sp.]
MIPILPLSKSDHNLKVGKAHNPPDKTISEGDFEAEYYRLFDEVEKIMARYETNDPYEQGDYYLEPRISNSRGLGLVITNPDIASPALLHELGEAIRRTDLRWEVYLASGEFEFGIFISAESALVWRAKDFEFSQPELNK